MVFCVMTPSRLVRINFSEEPSNSEGACLSEASVLTYRISRSRNLENYSWSCSGEVLCLQNMDVFAMKIADIKLTKVFRQASVCYNYIATLFHLNIIIQNGIATLYLVRTSARMPSTLSYVSLGCPQFLQAETGKTQVLQIGLSSLASKSFSARGSSSNYSTLLKSPHTR
jgi:hypothetical protein